MTPLRIIFAGSGEFGLPTLRALLDAGHAVVRVVTQPDRPAGRGRKLKPTPVGEFALGRWAADAAPAPLPLVRTADIDAEPLPDADAMVVIAFGQKIAQATAARPRLGSVNLHASRLPAYRGAAPIHWAILRGEAETGNSVIRLAPRMDAGAVLGMSRVAIGEMETTGELHDRLAADGAPLMLRVLEELAAGTATETPQDDRQATSAPKLSRETSLLNWSRPAADLARQIRGLSPWPGCRVRLRDAAGNELDRLTLVRARPAGPGASAPAAPGSLTAEGHVAAGDGLLELVEVQPEGKRPMPLAHYRHGHRWDAGLCLESVG